MKYAHLNRLINEDDDELCAVDVEIHVHRKGASAAVPGFTGQFQVKGDDLSVVKRTLQRHVDCLTNAEAADFIETNHKKAGGSAVKVLVRVPKIILVEVQREQAEAGSQATA